METLAANLLTYQPLNKFYKGNVTCSDGKKALIFTSNELLQELQKSTELYVDGTFNVSLYILQYSILLFLYITIKAIHLNNVNFVDCSTCTINESNVYTTYPIYECSK